MNEKKALETLRLSYQCIRIVKLIQRGWRSPTEIAKRVGCSKALAMHYIRRLK